MTYDDIIDLPHHISRDHPQMSMSDRAAQFSPFAALTGYDDIIRESARWTDTARELDESQMVLLNGRLQTIADHPEPDYLVDIRWFKPDARKVGGSFVTTTGHVKRIDTNLRLVILDDGSAIPIRDIHNIILPTEEENQW